MYDIDLVTMTIKITVIMTNAHTTWFSFYHSDLDRSRLVLLTMYVIDHRLL